MPLRMTAREMVEAADMEVESVDVGTARDLVADDNILFVDIRDIRELEREGRIRDAIHAPRGMLEFWVDPESPYHREVFASGRKLILYCASGWRSALATKTLQDMGLQPVAHLAGGFTAWKEGGGAVVEQPKRR